MPLELVATGVRTPELREYAERQPGPGEVRVRSVLAAEKHGTNLLFYRGIASTNEKRWDNDLGLMLPAEAETGWKAGFPLALGNMTAGVVEDVGAGVDRFKAGDRVYGHLPIRESHTVAEKRLRPAPDGVSDEALVCVDPALVALLGIREGHVRLGDTVAIFGMGAIGLMAVQMARLSGAIQVVAVEPAPLRAGLAREFGADVVIVPGGGVDVGLEIRRATGMKGVDIALETSGSHTALHHAIRGTRYGGTIVPVAWYHGEAAGLQLGDEWHFNRQTIVSGARLESVPYRDHPLWNPERVEETVERLFALGKLCVEGMLNPRVPMRDAAEAYRQMDEHPETAVKLAVGFPA